MSRIRHMLLVLWIAASLVLAPQVAQAATTGASLTCAADGSVSDGRLYFYYSQVNVEDGTCKFESYRNIFSQVVCDFVLILNDIMSKMYCGIQKATTQTLSIVFTLYVAVYGAQMLMGSAQLNAKEFSMRMLKIAAIWALCTQSAWGIGFMFNFFVTLIADASSWAINGVLTSPMVDKSGAAIDKWLGVTPMAVSSPNGTPPMFAFLDNLFYKILTGTLFASENKVLALFLAMLSFFFPIFIMGFWWVVNTLITLIKSVATFLLCLTAIAFLITLSPIFLSCMLFRTTQHFFENWLRFLISYSIQVILVFTIFVFWILVMIRFVQFYDELGKVIFPYKNTITVEGGAYSVNDTWGLCPYDTDIGADGTPTIKCDKDGFNSDLDNGGNKKDLDSIIMPSKLPTEDKFLYYIFYHLIALIIVTYAFKQILDNSQRIAISLSGAPTPAMSPGLWGGKFLNAGGSALSGAQSAAASGVGAASNSFTGMFRNALGLGVGATEGADRLKQLTEQADGLMRQVTSDIGRISAGKEGGGVPANVIAGINDKIRELNDSVSLGNPDDIARRIDALTHAARPLRRG